MLKGRHVAFFSRASNLVAGDTNDGFDVFVRDRLTRVTRLVSVGREADLTTEEILGMAISAYGRHVAFDSLRPDLVPGDTNGHADIFVRDYSSNPPDGATKGSRPPS